MSSATIYPGKHDRVVTVLSNNRCSFDLNGMPFERLSHAERLASLHRDDLNLRAVPRKSKKSEGLRRDSSSGNVGETRSSSASTTLGVVWGVTQLSIHELSGSPR